MTDVLKPLEALLFEHTELLLRLNAKMKAGISCTDLDPPDYHGFQTCYDAAEFLKIDKAMRPQDGEYQCARKYLRAMIKLEGLGWVYNAEGDQWVNSEPIVGTTCEVYDYVHGLWNIVDITAVGLDHFLAMDRGTEIILRRTCRFREI